MDETQNLILYSDYSREDVHDIFSPHTRFSPGSGTWGLQGIVEIPDKQGDFVFFVTFGQQQAGHIFDEWITEDGVISWQSQPSQSVNDRSIQQLIHHNEKINSIHLFLRTQRSLKYTYLGKLRCLVYDAKRDKPVYIYWQLLNWPIPSDVLNRINLQLQPANVYYKSTAQATKVVTRPNHRISFFTWRDRVWQVDYQALIAEVRDWIKRGLPEEAKRFKDWYVEIERQRISPKWLFHLITDAEYSEFDAPTARIKLSQIGIQSIMMSERVDSGNTVEEAYDLFSIYPQKRKRALEDLAQTLREKLTSDFQLDKVQIKKNAKSLDLRFINFKGWYEVNFTNSVVDVGVYFPGKSHKAIFIADRLNQNANEISEKIGYPVKVSANTWQPWGRMGFDIPTNKEKGIQLTIGVNQWIQVQAQYVEIITRFVGLTKELVNDLMGQDYIPKVEHQKTKIEHHIRKVEHLKSNDERTNGYDQILETKISTINQVLDGTAHVPSDEVLCDWVNFCYDFGLYTEGWMLFALVVPGQVNSWYYERTKKIARLCSLRTTGKG